MLLFISFVREVLVMEFIKGTPIMNLGNEMAKRGIDPGGKIAAMAKQKGQMILSDLFFSIAGRFCQILLLHMVK
jgi:hypothetical protein